MIIDFHTHVFPDKIAGKTLDLLAAKANISYFSNGTVDGLLEKSSAAGVDLSVILPVLTKPEQFDSVNRFAKQINDNYCGKLISFAGIHPACEDISGKMKFIKESGFKGLKIHPDYQGTYIDDDGYIEILQCAKNLDLTVVTHAGVDDGYVGEPLKCSPELLLKVISMVKHKKFVLAHFGGNRCYDGVYELLAGQDVYFDTAYVLKNLSKEDFVKMIKKHGADKVLFATDSPWSDISGDVEILKGFNLGKETEEKIFYKNGLELLK